MLHNYITVKRTIDIYKHNIMIYHQTFKCFLFYLRLMLGDTPLIVSLCTFFRKLITKRQYFS